MPTDGKVVKGRSTVDESMVTQITARCVGFVPFQPDALTTAPRTRSRLTGDAREQATSQSVIGGAVNQSGMLLIEATVVGEISNLQQIVRMVEQAQTSKVPRQSIRQSINSTGPHSKRPTASRASSCRWSCASRSSRSPCGRSSAMPPTDSPWLRWCAIVIYANLC